MEQKLVWHVISNRWNSAITEYALSAARALERKGYRNVFSALKNSPADKRAEEYGLETLPFDDFAIQNVQNFRSKSAFLGRKSVLLYGGPETFLSRFIPDKNLLRFFGQTLNTSLMNVPGLFSLSYSHISKFFVPNSFLLKKISERSKKKIKKIDLGLEIKNLNFDDVRKNNELVVLGRLDPVKGHEHIIKIFKNVLRLWPTTLEKPVLHIIGESANLSSEDIKKWISENKLKDDVIFTNHRVENISNVMRCADIGIIPSLGSEHICRVAEEFLLSGTPIFVSGAGATEETLFKGAGESYRDLNDEEASQKLLSFILRTRDEDASVRKKRSDQAKELFSLETMGKNLENFIFY
jgi:glycosyltransferase involved in cell wall biosynthesis